MTIRVRGIPGRKVLPIACLALFALTARADVATGDLHVLISGVTRDGVPIEIDLWRSPAGWLDRKSEESRYRSLSVLSQQGLARATFERLPLGTYAVTAYQDDNGNGRLDQGLFRLPKERVGFSNGVRPRLSAPRFTDAAVELQDRSLGIEITLRKLP